MWEANLVKFSFTKLFTSNTIKEIKTKEKIISGIVLSVFLRRERTTIKNNNPKRVL